MFASRFYRRSHRAALASALVVVLAGTAYAGPGPQFGPHGPRARGAHVEQVIAQLRAQLNLNTQQQVAFDNAIAASKTARDAGRGQVDQVRNAMHAELAKPAPDLRAISNLAETTRASAQARHAQIREQWLQLYDSFDPQQKAVVRDALLKRVERMEHFRERMHQRFGG